LEFSDSVGLPLEHRIGAVYGQMKAAHENSTIASHEAFEWDEDSVLPKGSFEIHVDPSTRAFIDATNQALAKRFGRGNEIQHRVLRPEGLTIVGQLEAEVVFQFSLHRSKNRR